MSTPCLHEALDAYLGLARGSRRVDGEAMEAIADLVRRAKEEVSDLTERLHRAEAVVQAARDVSMADGSPEHTDEERNECHELLHVALCAHDMVNS